MSRSFRHTPIAGHTCAETEKWDKRKANRKLRRLSRLVTDDEDQVVPALREVSNTWSFAKDGKHFMQGPLDPRWMRK